MDEATNKLLKKLIEEAREEVIKNVRYGDERLATVIEGMGNRIIDDMTRMEQRLSDTLGTIEDKINDLS